MNKFVMYFFSIMMIVCAFASCPSEKETADSWAKKEIRDFRYCYYLNENNQKMHCIGIEVDGVFGMQINKDNPNYAYITDFSGGHLCPDYDMIHIKNIQSLNFLCLDDTIEISNSYVTGGNLFSDYNWNRDVRIIHAKHPNFIPKEYDIQEIHYNKLNQVTAIRICGFVIDVPTGSEQFSTFSVKSDNFPDKKFAFISHPSNWKYVNYIWKIRETRPNCFEPIEPVFVTDIVFVEKIIPSESGETTFLFSDGGE